MARVWRKQTTTMYGIASLIFGFGVRGLPLVQPSVLSDGRAQPACVSRLLPGQLRVYMPRKLLPRLSLSVSSAVERESEGRVLVSKYVRNGSEV